MTERRIYLDSNVFIYVIETQHNVSEHLRQFLSVMKMRAAVGITSELSLAEVIMHATATQKRLYLELMVSSGLIELWPVTRQVLYDTVEYRKRYKTNQSDGRMTIPKLPDAIHVVTAIDARCETFISFDRRLRLPENLRLVGRDNDGLLKLLEELRHA